MYTGHWYDVEGKAILYLEPLPLMGKTLNSAINTARKSLPDSKLIVKNKNMDWGLISIEKNKRMLIYRDD